MGLKVEAQREDTNTHSTVLIVNMANIHFVTHEWLHISTPQSELELQVILGKSWEGKVAGMVALPAGKPNQKYQNSTHTLLSMFKIQVTVVSQEWEVLFCGIQSSGKKNAR